MGNAIGRGLRSIRTRVGRQNTALELNNLQVMNGHFGNPRITVPPAQRVTLVPHVTAGGVVLTSRGLFLDQEVSTSVLEMGGQPGTYLSALGLTLADFRRWAVDRATVLDVAAGGATFGDELRAAFGIQVRSIDLNHESYAGRFRRADNADGEARDSRSAVYIANIERLQQLIRLNPGQPIVPPEHLDLFAEIFDRRREIAAALPDGWDLRSQGDATNLEATADDSQGVYLNSWMMMYLLPIDRQRAIREAIRVVRPGGEIFIEGGDLTAAGAQWGMGEREHLERTHRGSGVPVFEAAGPARFREWFAEQREDDDTYVIDGSAVRIDEARSTVTRLVLNVLRGLGEQSTTVPRDGEPGGEAVAIRNAVRDPVPYHQLRIPPNGPPVALTLDQLFQQHQPTIAAMAADRGERTFSDEYTLLRDHPQQALAILQNAGLSRAESGRVGNQLGQLFQADRNRNGIHTDAETQGRIFSGRQLNLLGAGNVPQPDDQLWGLLRVLGRGLAEQQVRQSDSSPPDV